MPGSVTNPPVTPAAGPAACPRRCAEDHLQFETVLSELSDRFVSLPTDQVDAAIEDAQRRICECLVIDVSLLWQLSPVDPTTLMLTHRHQPAETVPDPEALNARDVFPWSLERTLKGETIVLNRLSDAPAEAADDVEFARSRGIKSGLGLPLSVGGGPPFGYSVSTSSGRSGTGRRNFWEG